MSGRRRRPAYVARTSPATGGRLVAALAAAAVLGGMAAPGHVPAAAAGAGQPGGRPRLSLSAQSTFVQAGGQFTLAVRIDRTGVPSTAELAVTVFGSVQTRSEFDQTVQDRIVRTPLTALPPIPLNTLAVDQNGDVTIRLPLQDPTQPRDASRVDLDSETGVFPVRVELRERNRPPLDQFTTHLVHFATPPTGQKMGLSLVLPLFSSIGLPADGPRQLPALEAVAGAAQALEGARSLPFALAASPELLTTLAASNEDRAGRTLDALRRVAAEHRVLALPYVPVSLPGLLVANLPEEVDSQLRRGAAVVPEVLGVQPDTSTWLAVEPLGPQAVDNLVGRGVTRMVAADTVLEPVPDQSVTLTRPFVLGGDDAEVPAVAADPGLSRHFNTNPNQVLEAHHLLADLAVLWLDAPGDDRRGVMAVPPREWKANRPFLEALASGLVQSPVVESMSLDAMLSSVEPAVVGRGVALVRYPADAPAPAAAFEGLAPEIRQIRRRLASLATVLGGTTPASAVLEDRLLLAQSAELRGVRQREAYLSSVEAGIGDHLEAIKMPQGRSITLTDRRAQIPVTFQNRMGTAARVVVTVQSDKLEFPEGASRPLELNRRNTTERFTVVARTSGAFPLRITLVSPDGNLVVGRARLTVRSTAASRVSVFVSVGAALFLAGWWGQHVVRGRRARRLVPP